MNSSTGFLSLPSEIRNMIYEVVVCPGYLCPKFWPGYPRQLTPTLLRTNKVIHAKASSLLYGQNCFEFKDNSFKPEDIVSFLDQIGTKNTGYIREIIIYFPRFWHLEPDNVTLDNHSSGVLATLQNRCPNLSTITTCLHTTDYMERLLAYDNKVATKALKMVNHRFRAILSSSLQEIFVEVYEQGPSDDIEMEDGNDIEKIMEIRDDIRQEMKALGWEICTFVQPEFWEGGFSDRESDDEYGSRDEGDDGDEGVDGDNGDDDFDLHDHFLAISGELL
ncbi:hypothetical protein V8F33_002672 [Rhypophila sp. PSN 637]